MVLTQQADENFSGGRKLRAVLLPDVDKKLG